MAARRGDAIVALVAICAALATLPDARVHGFKANDFKKCETSSFCQRLRDRPDGATREIYSIEGRWEPIGGRGGGWGALLAKVGEPRPLRVELTPYGDEGVVRLRVDEPAHPRYVVPGVLVDDLSPSEFADVQFASGGKDGDGARTVFLTKNPDVDVVVTHAPFRVAVRVRGHETTVFNRRSLFRIEYKRDAPSRGRVVERIVQLAHRLAPERTHRARVRRHLSRRRARLRHPRARDVAVPQGDEGRERPSGGGRRIACTTSTSSSTSRSRHSACTDPSR